MKNSLIFLLIVVLIGILTISLYSFLNYTPARTDIHDNTVLDVIDGDTFIIGSGESVRLICINTPEEGEKGYEEAREFLSQLILGKDVRLEKDISERDKYGRLLRYVYVNSSDIGEIFVNKEIVKEGYGKLFPYGNDTRRCGEISG